MEKGIFNDMMMSPASIFVPLSVFTGYPVVNGLLILMLFTLMLMLFLRWFQRDPERTITDGDGLVLSVADGRICAIETVSGDPGESGERVLVGVYLSPLDVHINRIPISGTVRHLSHHAGNFFPAYRKKASYYNEHQIIEIENPYGTVVIKQIAGRLARRIICNLQVGEQVRAGDRFGMIKLGSRVDLLLPPFIKIRVTHGERVKAGETIIGTMP